MPHNTHQDQAAGLRKLLGAKAPKKNVFFSSTTQQHKNSTLLNLSSACIQMGSSTQILDLRWDLTGISANSQHLRSNLWELALTKSPLQEGYYEYAQGGRISKLASLPIATLLHNKMTMNELSKVLQELFSASNIWLMDADFQANNPFQLPELQDSAIHILVENQAQSIKTGYLHLKSIAHQFGKKSVSLIVQNTELAQAQLIHRNMAKAANEFLALPLEFGGNIPQDAYLLKSSKLGKSVLDAYPMSEAAQAFRHIAGRLIEYSNESSYLNTPVTLLEKELEH